MFEFIYAKKVNNEKILKIIKEYAKDYYVSISLDDNGTVRVFIGERKTEGAEYENNKM